RNLQVGKSGELYYLASPAEPAIRALNAPAALERLVLSEREAKTVLDGVEDYRVSRDGNKLLLLQEGRWKSAGAAPEIEPGSLTPLPVDALSVRIEPRAEWRQIAREAWRLNRDFFYDPGYHGVDWDGVWDRYAPFLEHAATRARSEEHTSEL